MNSPESKVLKRDIDVANDSFWTKNKSFKTNTKEFKWQRSMSDDSETNYPTHFTKSSHYQEKDDEIDESISVLFNKTFSFCSPLLGWTLPDDKIMFKTKPLEIEELIRLKNDLNEVKNKLNDYDLGEWHQHTRSMNKSKLIFTTLKQEIRPEFMTQAWVKFYELCCSYDVICKEALSNGELFTLHLCEAPGAFITSLNHYLKLNCAEIKNWDWLATTLNPYYEGNRLSYMINDDRFILHTISKWRFGVDNTGDIMNVNNLKHLVGEARKLGPILLITADGSVDCQNNPGEQESIVSHLLFCEMTTALHILSVGGTFIMKIFTMFEHSMICLLYFLNCCFKSVHVRKPASSREGNSEVYLVCLDYVGTDTIKPWLRVFRNYIKPDRPITAMFPLSLIPDDFIQQLTDCALKFKKFQVETIETNIYLFRKDKHKSLIKMKTLQHCVAKHYIRCYRLQPLRGEHEEVVGKTELSKSGTLNLDPRLESGSFNDRIKKGQMKPFDRIKELISEMEEINCSWSFDDDVVFVQSVRPGRTIDIKCEEGGLELLGTELTQIIQTNCPQIFNSPTESTVFSYPKTELQSLGKECDENLERDSFWNLITVVEDFWRDKNLIIKNYPMLSQFNVGVIYMLAHMFEKVAFVRPIKDDFAVIFCNFRKLDLKMNKLIECLDRKMDEFAEKKSGVAVLSVVPIQVLADTTTDFYTCVTSVNHLIVKEDISKIVNCILDFSKLSNQ